MFQKISYTLLMCCIYHIGFAQLQRLPLTFEDQSGKVLQHALAGGLNNPQFSTLDLDGDGDEDLVYFDRQGNIFVPFLNQNGSYQLALQYQSNFPTIERFALLRDYNCDGIKDIFGYNYDLLTNRIGIAVYKGYRNTQNQIVFSTVKPIIEYTLKRQTTHQNLAISDIDLPAIDDIDNDGDLDILNFNSAGGYVEYFQNQSQELGYGCDSLLYVYEDDCWGRFYESGITEVLDLSPDIDSCANRPGWTPIRSPRHAGSTLLTLDMDNDGDKELLLGDLSFSNLNLLTNEGNVDTAFMTSQEVYFPQNTTFVNLDIFPAAFYEDVNHDGKKDLLVAPNIESNSENKQLWYYQNTGTSNNPIFSYQSDDFLVSEMVDLGTGAFPTLVDINGDGLLDLIVGNFYSFVQAGVRESSLYYYENIGTATQAQFKLRATDFANLKQYNFDRIAPTFGDLDGDGDFDLIVGVEDGKLMYIINQGSTTNPNLMGLFPNYANIDVGNNATPQLVDADRDGDLDLLIGERNGNTNYFENTGTTTTPAFNSTPTTATFGLVDAKIPGQINGNSAPLLIEIQGEYHFFVGNENGNIWHYDQVENNLFGSFSKINSTLDQIDDGNTTAPTLGDLDGDGQLDLILGNQRGGLTAYTDPTLPQKVISNSNIHQKVKIFPTPAQNSIEIQFPYVINDNVTIRIFTITGQSIYQKEYWVTDNTHKFGIEFLPTGSYFIHLQTAEENYIRPLLITK